MKKFSYLVFTLLLAFLGSVQIGSAQACDGFVNPNFDNVTMCPNNYDDVASFIGWNQVTAGTSDGTCDCATWWDHFGFGELGTCPPWGSGFVGAAAYSYYDCLAQPSGFAEYIGQCLTTPWVAGTTYTVSFDIYQTLGGGSIPISVMGYDGTTCPTIPFQAGTTGHDQLCGQPGWTELANQNETSSTSDTGWTTMTYTITPTTDVAYIAIGTCDFAGSTTGCAFTEYFVYDNFCIPSGAVCDVNVATDDCDGDGVLNGVDCDAADAMVAYAPGDACTVGGVAGTYDANCVCVAGAAGCNLPTPLLQSN